LVPKFCVTIFFRNATPRWNIMTLNLTYKGTSINIVVCLFIYLDFEALIQWFYVLPEFFFLKVTWLRIIMKKKKWYFDSKIVQTICDNFFFLHLRKKFRNIYQVEGRDQKNNLTSVPQKNVPSTVARIYKGRIDGDSYYTM
jgi:hypothetical protein